MNPGSLQSRLETGRTNPLLCQTALAEPLTAPLMISTMQLWYLLQSLQWYLRRQLAGRQRSA